MTELGDHELLAEFARSESEEAFATLVTRHVNLVYSAARRFSGNPDHAQEITQAVFIILARKAGSLRRCKLLSGWLYQTARLTAASFVRGEIRRERREQEAYMQSILNEPETEAWPQIAPLLDEAMGRLGETDRNALILRFFENKSAQQVGAALKLSEPATHKRVARALEKLRKFLTKRGVTLTTTLIAGAVSANSVQAAPVGLAVTVTAAAAKGMAVAESITALVKGTLKVMTWIKIKIAAASAAALLVVGGVPIVATLATSESGPANSGGQEAKLERYEFQAATVRYAYPPSKPGAITVVCSPGSPGKPLLSAEFSWRIGSDYPPAHALRIAAHDGLGNEFDPVGQDTAGIKESGGRQYWASGVTVFPRRGNEVYLRLLDNGELLAEFKIPNPAPGPHPVWTAQPVPVRATDGDLEVALAGFRTYQTSRETTAKRRLFPRTECVFSFRENNRETVAWVPVTIELADATGNHWVASQNHAKVENGAVRTECLGALWPGESAWKLRGEFRRSAEFPANELLHVSNIRMPDPDGVSEPHTTYDWNGAKVEVAAVIGTSVNHRTFGDNLRNARTSEDRKRWARLINSEQSKGCVSVVFDGEILSRNRRLTFVSATDEQGHAVQLAAQHEPEDIKAARPFSFALQVPEGAQELNLIVAVSETRFLEFLAKPDQIKE
ncbi:MAG: sigma-70 family RNA polymerase sigma factor [Verrucomicrobia bacterium]|nr:sigma-70 family RNA polymerase sigma factor [Verrucomicrobiota bacterium]